MHAVLGPPVNLLIIFSSHFINCHTMSSSIHASCDATLIQGSRTPWYSSHARPPPA